MSIISDLVVSSATAAFAHFGVTLDVPEQKPEPPRAERTVARTDPKRAGPAPLEARDCPEKGPAPVRRIHTAA